MRGRWAVYCVLRTGARLTNDAQQQHEAQSTTDELRRIYADYERLGLQRWPFPALEAEVRDAFVSGEFEAMRSMTRVE